MKYLEVRQEIVDMNGSNNDDNDVIDAFVSLTCEDNHYSDEDLEEMLVSYRAYEKAFPEFVKKGNALA